MKEILKLFTLLVAIFGVIGFGVEVFNGYSPTPTDMLIISALNVIIYGVDVVKNK
jgi:hypothetical protein